MWNRRQRPPDWEEMFLFTMRSVLKTEELAFDESVRMLDTGPASLLIRFDEHVRRCWWHVELTDPPRAKAVLKTTLEHPKYAEALLFMESCVGNGYVREQALRAMRGHWSRLACAAILIRTGDWVAQVAALAEIMLSDIAGTEQARHFFEFLELILLLRAKSRFARVWPAVESALLRPEWQQARRAAYENNRGRSRRFALELILKADASSSVDTLTRAACDDSPLVSTWAMQSANRDLALEDYRHVLRSGLQNRMASVRAEAVRRYAKEGFADSRPVLERAVLDRAHSVRQTAAYCLQQRYGISALPLWRQKFDAGAQRDELTLSLSELGDQVDESRLRAQLVAPRARSRAAALRGLWRLGVNDIGTLLEGALRDSASMVVGNCIAIYRRSAEILSIATLESALESAARPGLRARLLAASRLLSKWDQLLLLLAHLQKASPEETTLIDRELDRWLDHANRRFTVADSGQQESLRHLLRTLKQQRPSRRLEQIASLC